MRAIQILPVFLFLFSGCGRNASTPRGSSASIDEIPADLKTVPSSELIRLQGVWAPEGVYFPLSWFPPGEGFAWSIADVQGRVVRLPTLDGNELFAILGVDEQTQPMTIDFTLSAKDGKPLDPEHGLGRESRKTEALPCKGICRFDGDRLHIAFSKPGEPRPAEFLPQAMAHLYRNEGTKAALLVLRKFPEPVSERDAVIKAIVGCKILERACINYHVKHAGIPPENLETLVKPLQAGSPHFIDPKHLLDPWGNKYQYDSTMVDGVDFKPHVFTINPVTKEKIDSNP